MSNLQVELSFLEIILIFTQNIQVEDEEDDNKETDNSHKTITNEQLVTDLCDNLLGILEHELKP